jgi:hypothetical protein
MPDTVVTSAAFDPLTALSEAVFLFFPGPAQCDVMYIAGTGYKEQGPKTAKSRRKITLPLCGLLALVE